MAVRNSSSSRGISPKSSNPPSIEAGSAIPKREQEQLLADYAGLTVFKPGLVAGDLCNEISIQFDSLDAMTTAICGQGAESFFCWSDSVKEAYLFELSRRVGALHAHFEAYCKAVEMRHG